jgi:hypothetical protein
MIFSIGNFDQKVPLLDTSIKNHLSHFGQVVYDMTNLIGGLLTTQVVGYFGWPNQPTKNLGNNFFGSIY